MTKLSDEKLKLLAQMRETRSKIDPAVLEKAKTALEIKSGIAEAYDKKNASAAIRLFLAGHENAAGFEKKLLEMMRRDK